MSDEKTRPAQRAVRRKPAITHLATRKVAAVKRRPAPPPGVEAHLVEPFRVLVLRRGELSNAAGEADNGWVIRDDYERKDCLQFVLAKEPLLNIIARTLWKDDDYSFDVMAAGEARGALVLDRARRLSRRRAPTRGSGQLFDQHGRSRASFLIRRRSQVTCYTDDKQTPLLEVIAVRDELIVKARRLTIAHAIRVMSGGIISTFSHLEVALEKSATPFERLCLVSALVLSDAWELQYPSDGRDDDFV
jgi:hypothetical protein